MKIDVIGRRRVFIGISGAAIAVSLIMLLTMGLNFGIDFSGGTLLERAVPGRVAVTDVERVLASDALQSLNLGTSFVQPLHEEGAENSIFLIRTGAVLADAAALRLIDDSLSEAFGEVTPRRTESVGPVIGKELQRNAVLALILSGIGILAYISVRFEYRFGAVAVASLLHDVIIVLGVLSLLQVEINTSFIAAILTVVGYSINDTIVIFDRIRERLRMPRRPALDELVNSSVNEMLTRSINTSLTTLFVVVALFVFGGASIRDFTLALLVGIIAGTYSSIFVASPVWFMWRRTSDQKRAQTSPAS